MSATTYILFSCVLTFGAPLAIAIHELIAFRRRPPGEGPGGHRIDPAPPPPKPLPDCLIPKPYIRIRELEDA